MYVDFNILKVIKKLIGGDTVYITKVDEMKDLLEKEISLIKFKVLSEQVSDLIDTINDADEMTKGDIIEQLKEILEFIKILR